MWKKMYWNAAVKLIERTDSSRCSMVFIVCIVSWTLLFVTAESHFKDNPALSMLNDSDDEVVYGWVMFDCHWSLMSKKSCIVDRCLIDRQSRCQPTETDGWNGHNCLHRLVEVPRYNSWSCLLVIEWSKCVGTQPDMAACTTQLKYICWCHSQLQNSRSWLHFLFHILNSHSASVFGSCSLEIWNLKFFYILYWN